MQKKISILYIISRIDKALAFEWLADDLDREIFSPSFILLNPGPSRLMAYLKTKNLPVTTLRLSGKGSYARVLIQLWWILVRKQPDIIHCHLFDATVLGMIAGKMAGIKRRIFTRHHSTIHHTTNPEGLKWDRLCNWLSTDIVAVSKNIRDILVRQDHAPDHKIRLVVHGFNLSYFESQKKDRVSSLRSKYKVPEQRYPVIGVISRYLEWKGIQYIIPALVKLKNDYPGLHLILANANGDYKPEIGKLLGKLPVENFIEIPFEEDLAALYGLFDIFIHIPVDPSSEAFGQVYIEALLSGVPSIFTLSGIAGEMIRNRENALVVDFKNSEQIYRAVLEILRDENLRKNIIARSRDSVLDYSMENHINLLQNLYLNR